MEAILRGEMAMMSTSGHHRQYQNAFSGLGAMAEGEAYACAPADRSDVLCENFSVDDLLDLGDGVEDSCSHEEGFLVSDDATEEDEREAEREGTLGSSANRRPSSLSFGTTTPTSSDFVVPVGDAAELEWVSRFVDDSYSEFRYASLAVPSQRRLRAPPPPTPPAAHAKEEAFKARLTGSGGDQKRNWGGYCFFAGSLAVPAKARSRRSRIGGGVWSLLPPPLLTESPPTSSCSSASSAGSCSASSQQGGEAKKKRGRKPRASAGAAASVNGSAGVEPHHRRRCSHCGVEKTPQWREGPTGAKTLCNACGVRYKSGRLLPEYRPACSPTFVGHLHSNSHRKVLEMRRRKELAPAAAAGAGAASTSWSGPLQPPATPAQVETSAAPSEADRLAWLGSNELLVLYR